MAIIRKHKDLGEEFMKKYPHLPELPTNSPKQRDSTILPSITINDKIYFHVSEIGGGGTANTYEALSEDLEWVVLKIAQHGNSNRYLMQELIKREGLILQALKREYKGNIEKVLDQKFNDTIIEGTIPFPGAISRARIGCPFVEVLDQDEDTLVLTYSEGEDCSNNEFYRINLMQRLQLLGIYAHGVAIAHKEGIALCGDVDLWKSAYHNIDSQGNASLRIFDLGCTLINNQDISNAGKVITEPLEVLIARRQIQDIELLAGTIRGAFGLHLSPKDKDRTFDSYSLEIGYQWVDIPKCLEELTSRTIKSSEKLSAAEYCECIDKEIFAI